MQENTFSSLLATLSEHTPHPGLSKGWIEEFDTDLHRMGVDAISERCNTVPYTYITIAYETNQGNCLWHPLQARS